MNVNELPVNIRAAVIEGSRHPVSSLVTLTTKPKIGDTLVISWPPGGTVTAEVTNVGMDGLLDIKITKIKGNVPGLEEGQTTTINATWP